MIVFIVLNSLFNKLLIETHLDLHLCYQLLIHVEFFCVETKILIFRLMHQVKRVSADVINVNSLFRISHEKF